MTVAITRGVSPSMARCELTHAARQPIDPAVAAAQHAGYERALAELGCEVRRLPTDPDLPDAVFIEDTAVITDELAVITRPGAASRRPETVVVAEALQPLRPIAAIQPPGTLDGGDVLRVGRVVFVGESLRTNADGIRQLAALLEPLGYTVRSVPVTACLHLKSAVTAVGGSALLINREWVNAAPFAGFDLVDVHRAEPAAANALLLAGTVVLPSAFPHTRNRLQQQGLRVREVDVSELAKAEGGVTCCCLLLGA